MNKKPVIHYMIVLISLTIFLTSCFDTDPPDKAILADLKFASGPKNSTAYTFARGFIDSSGEIFGVFLDNKATSGSLQNAGYLVSGRAYLGLAQEDVFFYAREKYLEQFKDDPDSAEKKYLKIASQLQAIMAGYKKYAFLLVHTGNITDISSETARLTTDGIITMADLLDRTSPIHINIGAVDSNTYITAKTIIDAHAFSSTPEIHTDSAAEGLNKVISGTYDAAFIVDEYPSSLLTNINATAEVELIRVYMPEIKKSYREDGIIFDSDYEFQDRTINDTLTVRELLVTGPFFTSTIVDVFIDYVESHADEYQSFQKKWGTLDMTLSREYILDNPQKCNYYALCFFAGQDPLDPFYLKDNFLSGEATGLYHDMTVELGYLMDRNIDLNLKEKNTTGTWENSYWMSKGSGTMGLMQDDIYSYLKGYKDELNTMQIASMKKIAPLQYEYVHLCINSSLSPTSLFANNNAAYSFRVQAVDRSGGTSTGKTASARLYNQQASTAVKDLTLQAGNGTVTVSWKNPANPWFHHNSVFFRQQGDSTDTSIDNDAINRKGTLVSGLSNDTPVTVSVTMEDASDNTLGAVASATITPCATSSGNEINNLIIQVKNRTVVLKWDEPDSDSYSHSIVHYGQGNNADTSFTGPVNPKRTLVYPSGQVNSIKQLLSLSYPSDIFKINVGPKTSGTFISAVKILETYRSDLDAFDEVHYGFDSPYDAIEKVSSGEYHAAFVTSGAPYPRFYSHDTYSMDDRNIKLISAQFNDSNGNGNYSDDIPPPYREGVIDGEGEELFENYPYPDKILPMDITTVRTRTNLVASPVYDDSNIRDLLKAIFRKTYYRVYPFDPDDYDFLPDPVWVPITANSFEALESDYDTFEEYIVGAKEYFARYPFGWSPEAAKYYLSLFPDN